jgi:hypothetical protein
MAAFPDNLGCLHTVGWKEGLPVSKRYLGGGIMASKATATVSFSMDRHVDMKNFTSWYINTIGYGTLPFTLNAPFFGVSRDWNVQLNNDLTSKLIGKITLGRDFQLDLTILDDISTYV